MSNSVVKVTDSMLNDSLLLLVGEDGTVTPDKETVESYLNSKSGATDIQVMHINKSDGQTIDVSIDNLTYVPDADGQCVDEIIPTLQTPITTATVVEPPPLYSRMDNIARHLHNIRLDHDYTPHSPNEEIDELAKTLSILEGGGEIEPQPETSKVPIKVVPAVAAPAPQPPPQQQQQQQPAPPPPKPILQKIEPPKPIKPKIVETPKPTLVPHPIKVVKRLPPKPKVVVKVVEDDDDDDDDSDDDYSAENDDDSDFDMEIETKPKPRTTRSKNKKVVQKTRPSPTKPSPPKPQQKEVVKEVETPPLPKQEKPPPEPEKQPDNKKTTPVKKEKKTPKPIPDDFALFSTPDIIRRVGGKEPTTPITPQTPEFPTDKPAKIENRSKSVQETSPLPPKSSHRMSLDSKVEKPKPIVIVEKKKKEIAAPIPPPPQKRASTETKKEPIKTQFSSQNTSDGLEMPSAEDIREIMSAENNLGSDLGASDQNNMPLDSGGLDLDPSLLDNINNDMITEDILYQVAQSLAQNTELSNVIDKSLTEGNLLDPAIMHQEQHQVLPSAEPTSLQENSTSTSQKGTQIVRPDGRIVVIPPIERPTTRSRNKTVKEVEKPAPKFTHKPLDEEHVSGNELDSSDDEEEESEDDPNKLWCICNQPHNNRFMICCDTCEEWYHGKCVNITKAMGQQMESEGKEWICLFCKDPKLKRPQAAARRIRKASRNSRQSSDSAGSTKVPEGGSVPCVVCQKASRINSIFCSESCILAHAQGVERVVVFERATGNMLTGNKAPSAANLEQWLKDHPGYEVVRSAGKVVTAKPTQNVSQSKLKFVKNVDNNGVSLTIHKKTVSLGVLKHLPKTNQHANQQQQQQQQQQQLQPQQQQQQHQQKTVQKPPNTQTLKVINKQVAQNFQQPKKVQQIPQTSQKKESPQLSTPNKKVVQTVIKSPTSTTPKEKPMPVKTPKARQAEQSVIAVPQQKQENIRENVQKTLFEQLTNRLKMVEDLKLSEDDVKSISTEIESQLYKCFGDTGQKYRNKYRSLIFNIKDAKNQTLWRRICEKSINPYQLVRLSPDDLASQELALWREREAKHQLDMIKKSELELLNCTRQYVLKTHKGEQILEDNRPSDHIDTTEVITSLTEVTEKDSSKPGGDHSKDRESKRSSKHSYRDKERKSSKDKSEKDHHRSGSRHRSASKDHERSRRRSKSRERKHSDRKRSKSRGRDRHRKSSHKSSRHRKDEHRGSSTDKLDKKSKEILEQLVDNKIVPPLEDRLWKHVPQEDLLPAPTAESDSDHEPTSTVTIPTPPRQSDAEDGQTNSQSSTEDKEKVDKDKETDIELEKEVDKEKPEVKERSLSPPVKSKSEEIWRGVINMIDVAQISITAHEVSGDCNGLGSELPGNLDIVGRISPDTVWDYIGKMKCSNSKAISLVRLNAINVEEKMTYLALYSYLSSRNRLGVVKSTNKAVKDFYILPLASQKPIPPALLPISGPGFEESRPALLLGIIVRDKRKRPLVETPSQAPVVAVKKTKTELPPSPPPRSYTPPAVKDPRLKLPLPPPVTGEEDDDEPYSPEDSDPDSMTAPSLPSDSASTSGLNSFLEAKVATSFQPFANKFDNIPGLGNPVLPSNTQELEREMEKLNKEIEMQKSEIDSISQNIATAAASTEIGTSALANIALPSNLQQILDSIKTISAVSSSDNPEAEPAVVNPVKEKSPDLTIPLILPTNFSRPLQNSGDASSPATIPLNLPNKKKTNDQERSSVLGSLSEEDLIRKAAEMLGETPSSSGAQEDTSSSAASKPQPISFTFTNSMAKRPKLEHPPLPGLNDD